MVNSNRIGVAGAGAWGTALALVAHRGGADVTLWGRSAPEVERIRERRTNDRYLAGQFIDPAITVTTDLAALTPCDALILAVPSQAVRTLCIALADLISATTLLVVASKGIERGSLLLMSEVLGVTLPDNPALILSGPNFAQETARGQPTATVLAAAERPAGEWLQALLSGKYFRPYLSEDRVGVQIGGAIKNVVAVACGIVTGYGLGENARAAVMTRGLSEMSRLAVAKGGKRETLLGLAGVADLMLSSASASSRNTALGIRIGEAAARQEAMPLASGPLAEGALTAEAVQELALKLGVPMPLCGMVAQILSGQITVGGGIEALLSRPVGYE